MACDVIGAFQLGVLAVVLFVFDILTLPLYFLLQRPWRRWIPTNNVWAMPVRSGDPSSPWARVHILPNNPLKNIQTMDELFRASVARHGPSKCFATRAVLAEAEVMGPAGKIVKKKRLGGYSWFTYNEVNSKVELLARGMLAMGIQPRQQILLLAETRIEWILTALACFRINVPVATLYTTASDDGMIHVITSTEVTHIFASQDMLPRLQRVMLQIPRVTHVVYMEGPTTPSTNEFPEKITIFPFSHLEGLGSACSTGSTIEGPNPDDIAFILHTSGSTGVPKGVLITHKNGCRTSAGCFDSLSPITCRDTHIACLPLAHVFEIIIEYYVISVGGKVGYSSPHTLTDKSPGLLPGCLGDATLLRPTMTAAVPLILSRICKQIVEHVDNKQPLSKSIFQDAVRYKSFWCKKGFQTPILNRLMFRDAKRLLGGRMRAIICGGAPLSPDTHNFLRACLDAQIMQAYGSTETSANTFTDMNDFRTGRVGAPLSTCYVKLINWEEGGYRVTDKPYPRGEIVVGGETVTPGYFKNEALTKEVLKEEDGIRWFSTADIGEIYPDGTIKIIDRKKDLVKLQFGKFVPLGKVEADLKNYSLVENICVLGNSSYNYLVALLVPNRDQLSEIASAMGKGHLTFLELCVDEEVVREITRRIMEYGQKCGLQTEEIPIKVKICTEEWLPDTGLVTAALKIRRTVIQQYYHGAIDAMYNSNTSIKGT